MNLPWHTVIVAIFVVSLSVYAVSSVSDEAGWIFVLVLLLGISIAIKSFPSELTQIASAWGGDIFPPEPAPGQTSGPY